jgi:hypothetical protein
MRQARQSLAAERVGADVRVSPQRAHADSLRTENSVRQTGQIGTLESCGKGEPQRAHAAGRRAQLKLSTGLRGTRTTARQRVVSDGGTTVVLATLLLWKTHLASGRRQMLPVAPSIAHYGFCGSGRSAAAMPPEPIACRRCEKPMSERPSPQRSGTGQRNSRKRHALRPLSLLPLPVLGTSVYV